MNVINKDFLPSISSDNILTLLAHHFHRHGQPRLHWRFYRDSGRPVELVIIINAAVIIDAEEGSREAGGGGRGGPGLEASGQGEGRRG